MTKHQPVADHPAREVASAGQLLLADVVGTIVAILVPSARRAPADVDLLTRLLVRGLDAGNSEWAPRLSVQHPPWAGNPLEIVDVILIKDGVLARALPVASQIPSASRLKFRLLLLFFLWRLTS